MAALNQRGEVDDGPQRRVEDFRADLQARIASTTGMYGQAVNCWIWSSLT